MIRKKISDVGYVTNRCCVIRNTEFMEFDAALQPMYVEYVSSPGASDSWCFVSDIGILLNQDRIRKMSPDNLNHWMQRLQPHSDSLSELRSKVSDDDLLTICKSRYLQTPSELLAWDEWLRDNYDDILDKHKQAQEAFKKKFDKLNKDKDDSDDKSKKDD